MRQLLFIIFSLSLAAQNLYEWNMAVTCAPPGTSSTKPACVASLSPKNAKPVVVPVIVSPPKPVTLAGWPPTTSIRTDLPAIAYSASQNRAEEGAWQLKAGESLVNEFGVTVTRITDEDTIPGSSMATHFYSSVNPLCGNNFAMVSDGGGYSVMNIVTRDVKSIQYQQPDLLLVKSAYWHPTDCDVLYVTGARYGALQQYQLWKYQVSTNTMSMVKDFTDSVKAVLPGVDGYMTLSYISPDTKRMLFSVERYSKEAPGVVILDEDGGVRVYPLNPLPTQYRPALRADSFRSAGIGGATKDGRFYVVQYNGSAPGINSMSYVIPWQVDPRFYAAYSINGTTPTYHGGSLTSGVIHIASSTVRPGKSLDYNTDERCKTSYAACTGAPNWWYTLRMHDYTKTPSPTAGYPSRETILYTAAAGGYHITVSPDGKTVASGTYQESAGGNNYLIKSPTHNEIFLTFVDDSSATWAWDGPIGSFTRIIKQSRMVRLSATNTTPWDSVSSYWAAPRAAFDDTGCRIVFASTNTARRIDTFMLSNFCKP